MRASTRRSADAYLAEDERAAAMDRVAAAEVKIGATILRFLAEGVAMPQVADGSSWARARCRS